MVYFALFFLLFFISFTVKKEGYSKEKKFIPILRCSVPAREGLNDIMKIVFWGLPVNLFLLLSLVSSLCTPPVLSLSTFAPLLVCPSLLSFSLWSPLRVHVNLVLLLLNPSLSTYQYGFLSLFLSSIPVIIILPSSVPSLSSRQFYPSWLFGPLFWFTSKSDQQVLSSSIRLEAVILWT